MKKILLSVLSLSLLATACKKKDNTPANSASVTFVNGCAGTQGIDTKINNVNVGGAMNISFRGNTGYKPVTSGSANIVYYLTNLGTPVSNVTSTLVTGGYYTAFSGGVITAPTFLLTTDDLTAPASGMAKIRFVNLSPDAQTVTAYAQTTAFATGVTSQSASAFFPVTAGAYEIKAGDPSNISTVISAGQQTLAAGKIYTVMLTGTATGSGVSGLQLTMLNNN